MPDQLAAYGRTWEDHHPDWEHKLWTEDNLPPLRNQDLYDRADDFAMPGRGNQVRSDIVRFEVLSLFGGVYVDADFECLKPIDALCDVECFAAWEVEERWVNCAIFGAVPQHPFVEELIILLAPNIARYRGRAAGITSSTSLSGPRYLTPIYRRHQRHVTVYPQKWFYPYRWQDVGTPREAGPWPDAYAVHHWGNRRNLQGQPGWDYAGR